MASPALASASTYAPPIPKQALRITTRASETVAAAISASPTEEIIWPIPIQQAIGECTAKQAKFAIYVASGLPAYEAYRRTYDISPDKIPPHIHTDASQTLSQPKVSRVATLVQSWLAQGWLLDALEVREYGLAKFYEMSCSAKKEETRLKATELLMRASGQFLDRKEVIHRDGADLDNQTELAESILALLDSSILAEANNIEEPVLGLSNDSPSLRLNSSEFSPSVRLVCDHCAMSMSPLAVAGDGDGI